MVIKKKQFLSPKKVIGRLPRNSRVYAVVSRLGVLPNATGLATLAFKRAFGFGNAGRQCDEDMLLTLSASC